MSSRWIPRPWVALSSILAVSALAAGVWTYNYARQRIKAMEFVESAGAQCLQMENPPWCAECPRWMGRVESINLYRQPVSDLRAIASLDEVRILGVNDSPLTDEGFGEIRRFRRLEVLWFRGTGITDTGLGALRDCRHLKELRIVSEQVTDAGLETLASLPLRKLDLWSPHVTEAGIEHLGRISTLECLVLRQLPTRSLPHLAGLPLRQLTLQRTTTTDTDLAELPTFPTLEVLDLEGTRITDAGLTHLAKQPITNLDLSDTAITDAGLLALTKLPLSSLDLSGTAVTARGLKTLAGMRSLKSVEVSPRSISEDEAKELNAGGVPVQRNLRLLAE